MFSFINKKNKVFMIEFFKCSNTNIPSPLSVNTLAQNIEGEHAILENRQAILNEQSPSKLQAKIKINKTGFLITFSVIRELFQRVMNAISNMLNQLSNRRIHDNNKILSSQKRMKKTQQAWLLNLALLRDAAESSTLTLEQRQQIQFLAANYLHKAAPIHISTMRYFFQKVESMFQTSGLSTENDYYHRFSLARQINLGAEINKNLAMGNKSPLISTDTTQFQHLLPLKFTVIESSKPTSKDLSDVLSKHFSCDNPEEALNNDLSTPFLFNLTNHLKDEIKTDGNKTKEKTFKYKYNSFKQNLEQAIDEVAKALVQNNPVLGKNPRKLKKFIRRNMTCICCVDTRAVTGIKVLPLFFDTSKTKVLSVHSTLSEFIVATGLGIGGVSLRRKLLNGLKERQDVNYEGPSAMPGRRYYSQKEDFTSSSIYQRLATAFGSQAESIASIDQRPQIFNLKERLANKPHIQLLGKATIDLLNGVFDSITPEQWEKLHLNETYSQITQASLFKIKEHLATAEMHLDDFAQFAQQIELVSAEIATLLEIAQPFKEDDFAQIYKDSLFSGPPMSELPRSMQLQFQMGLSKTSVNTFAGVSAAVLAMNPDPQRAYSQGFYFEQAGFIGYDYSFENIIDNSNTKKIDLYCGQFNPNIEIDKKFTHYERRDIANDIRLILDKDKAAQYLTIAIDCTIDDYNSENVKNTLMQFKDEIDAGRLNFVFFKSGQKMDMLGMDNYYGAPFYMVNNGAVQWKPFESLTTNPVHKTDSLSTQWFSLSSKYIPKSLEQYRQQIFENTRAILDKVPAKLKPDGGSTRSLRVNTAAPDMKAAFIDIKVLGPRHKLRSGVILGKFYEKMLSKGIKIQTRATFGLYHSNALIITVNEIKGCTSIRLHPGLNPEENAAFIEFLQELADEVPDEERV